MLAPSGGDCRTAKKIAKYFKGTKKLNFLLKGDNHIMTDVSVFVEAYSDADYIAKGLIRRGAFMAAAWLWNECEGNINVPHWQQ